MAADAASDFVAEADVIGGGEAVRIWGIEADGEIAMGHGTWPHTNIGGEVDVTAVGYYGVRAGEGSERVDWLADEGQLGVGGRYPVHHLFVGHETRCRLHNGTVSDFKA